jgi:hypothetical protein
MRNAIERTIRAERAVCAQRDAFDRERLAALQATGCVRGLRGRFRFDHWLI